MGLCTAHEFFGSILFSKYLETFHVLLLLISRFTSLCLKSILCVISVVLNLYLRLVLCFAFYFEY